MNNLFSSIKKKPKNIFKPQALMVIRQFFIDTIDITNLSVEEIEFFETSIKIIMATLQQINRAIYPEEDKYLIMLSALLNNTLKPYGYFTDIHDLS